MPLIQKNYLYSTGSVSGSLYFRFRCYSVSSPLSGSYTVPAVRFAAFVFLMHYKLFKSLFCKAHMSDYLII